MKSKVPDTLQIGLGYATYSATTLRTHGLIDQVNLFCNQKYLFVFLLRNTSHLYFLSVTVDSNTNRIDVHKGAGVIPSNREDMLSRTDQLFYHSEAYVNSVC